MLLVDDDIRLRELLRRYLIGEGGFYVTTAGSVLEARSAIEMFLFDGLVVDIMMPGGPGTDLFSLQNLPPVLLLSAMGEPHHRIHGLELGAQDYVIKPFDPKELVLRLGNMMNRYEKSVQLGPFSYCVKRKILLNKDRLPIALSHSEAELLHYFACRAHQPLSRESIAEALFPQASTLRLVDVQVNRLRKKIEQNSTKPVHLISLRGKGYCLIPQPSSTYVRA